MDHKKRLLIISVILFVFLGITYLNHFDNDFHFDDFHTITLNPYVKSLDNFPDFFTNYQETQSTRPTVKTFRPIVTTMNAISYWLGGDYNPFYFHLTIYIIFIIQLILMFLLFRKILGLSYKHKWNDYIALFATAWYAFHAVNAETINYIIARSDSMSTMFVVAAIVIWAYFPAKRKFGYFLIPAILAIFTKEPAAMLAPILFFYILFFEQDMSIHDVFSGKRSADLKKALRKALPTLIILIAITYIVVFVVRVSKEPNYGFTVWEYARTQTYIWFHYFISFFFPYKLSADPDFKIIKSFSDPKMWLGFAFIITLIYTIIRTSKTKKLRPISFGLIWFSFALVPTSSIFVLGQIANDHRMFFPYVGLVLSVSWAITLVLQNYEKKIIENKKYKNTVLAMAVLILAAHAYGTYQRNIVWDSEASLWADTAEKSPNNGRALMNHGVYLMGEGNIYEAKKLFKDAEKAGYVSTYLMVNLAIVYDEIGDNDSSMYYYNRAVNMGRDLHIAHFYLARKYYQDKKYRKAIHHAKKSTNEVNHYMRPRYLLMDIYAETGQKKKLENLAKETLRISKNDEKAMHYLNNYKGSKLDILLEKVAKNPDAGTYLEISLIHYRNEDFLKAVDASKKAIEYKPESAVAYNNIGAAYNKIGEYDKAIEALNKALEINPGFQRAKNNLQEARKFKKNPELANKKFLYEKYIEQSLQYYYNDEFEKCIEACYKALEIRPNSAEAYNNICSAYNKMAKYKKAADACKKALEINPDFKRAENNLNIAKRNLP